MTRIEMESEVSAEVLEILGDLLEDNPFAVRRDVWRSVEEVADRTDCYKGSRTASLIANQARYCIPGFKRLTGAIYTGVSGIKRAFPLRDVTWMDTHASYWRDPVFNVPLPDATNLVMLSNQEFEVFHPPSQSRAGALVLEGYMKPGEKWKWALNSQTQAYELQAADDADECPLPSYAHAAATAGAICKRLQTLAARYPAAANSLPLYERRYLQLLGNVESDTTTFSARVPHGKHL